MKEIKQPKVAKEESLKVGKKVIGGIVFIAIMLIAYAILSMQQIGEINNIAPETARALEDNEFATTIIMKDKATGEVLPGAVFKLEKPVGFFPLTYGQIGEYTTNDEGKIDLVLEKDVTYRISETTAPTGYNAIESTFDVIYYTTAQNFWGISAGLSVTGDAVINGDAEYVDADGVIYVYNENVPVTPVELNVVDGEGNPLEGAAFRVSYTDDTTVGEYTSDKEGKIKLELENGDYIIIQLTPIEGYVVAEPVNIRVTDGIYAVLNSDGTEKSEANKASVVVNDLKEIVINKVRRKWRVNSNTRCII